MNLAEKRALMMEIVARWQQSGQTQSVFAEENRLALGKLRYRIRQKREKQIGNFVEISAPVVSDMIIRYPKGLNFSCLPKRRWRSYAI